MALRELVRAKTGEDRKPFSAGDGSSADRMRFGTALSQFRCNDWSEMIYPASDCFLRNYNSALREQILDVTKATKREPEIEPDRLVNELRREPISVWLPSRRRRDNAVADRGALAKTPPKANRKWKCCFPFRTAIGTPSSACLVDRKTSAAAQRDTTETPTTFSRRLHRHDRQPRGRGRDDFWEGIFRDGHSCAASGS